MKLSIGRTDGTWKFWREMMEKLPVATIWQRAGKDILTHGMIPDRWSRRREQKMIDVLSLMLSLTPAIKNRFVLRSLTRFACQPFSTKTAQYYSATTEQNKNRKRAVYELNGLQTNRIVRCTRKPDYIETRFSALNIGFGKMFTIAGIDYVVNL